VELEQEIEFFKRILVHVTSHFSEALSTEKEYSREDFLACMKSSYLFIKNTYFSED